ncbi:hypothetical protein [Salimicrobium halophilum]|uniref:Uncharacterized protein n=1 Tax=Salimicrobium halophilum TaxID=86666 RepID=A0A1G8W5J9_9BACI|nr:hypothetical protein [Salimicrobium halophilum]SDJ73568.1 hypothetical protein SAMN04490247_3037 [Salimicrobium halophilum]
MNETIQAFLPLLGVLLGGFISYFAQTHQQKKDEIRKDKRNKLLAYNTILKLDGSNTPLIHPTHYGMAVDFDYTVYKGKIREVLYDNLHLFDYEIANNIMEIDEVALRAEIMGPEHEDTEEIYDLYKKVIEAIYTDYKNQKMK